MAMRIPRCLLVPGLLAQRGFQGPDRFDAGLGPGAASVGQVLEDEKAGLRISTSSRVDVSFLAGCASFPFHSPWS